MGTKRVGWARIKSLINENENQLKRRNCAVEALTEDKPQAAAPDGGDSQQSQAASETTDKVLDILSKGNHRMYAPGSTAEADHIPEIRDALAEYEAEGGTIEDLANAIAVSYTHLTLPTKA